ncbi:33K [Simian adenovirus 19]|uniref:33K n=1 Tax=Simian adenovirus 19 TaxID=38416 RepID=A0A0M4MU09_9ADEN|nr:33K [Simian adenovirus 19]ALE30439.1 33K [Simian adenovirus 19]
MPPKGVKQLIAQQRATKQQELLRQHLEEEQESSDAWDSQAEEASEDEEMEGWDSLDEEEEEVEDEPTGEKPPASSALSLSRLSKPNVPTPEGSHKASRRWDTTGSPKKSKASSRKSSVAAFSTAKDSPAARELRNRIFPTLYAIFQQSRGQQQELKIKNRTLRSLTRSCLYHRREDQLQRTLDDAEALFNKYCSVSLKD